MEQHAGTVPSPEMSPARLYIEDGYLVAERRGKTYRRQLPPEVNPSPSLAQTIRILQETGNGTEIDDLVEKHFDNSNFNKWMDAVYSELKERGEMPLDEEYRD